MSNSNDEYEKEDGDETAVCVCVCARVYTMCQEWTLCMYSPCQERTSNQEQNHSMSAIGFGIRFGLLILKNPGINQNYGGSLSLSLALKLFLESF